MPTTAIRERPIIFNDHSIRAIQEGRKTQTRKVAKPPAKAVFLSDDYDYWRIDVAEPGTAYLDDESGRLRIKCPYGQPGDRLWVRETWGMKECREYDPSGGFSMFTGGTRIVYKAGGKGVHGELAYGEPDDDRWRSPIFMPRWASRLTLEIVGVKVERLQDISEEAAQAEGCDGDCPIGYIPAYLEGPYSYHFAQVWDAINGKRPGCRWVDSPRVWAITFKWIDNHDS